MISQQEFEALLGDDSKTIADDIAWVEDMDHSPAREFRANVASDAGRPLFVVGRYSACGRHPVLCPHSSWSGPDLRP